MIDRDITAWVRDELWDRVPVNISVLGDKANSTRPEIEQIMIANDLAGDDEAFERDLYLIRRRIEKAAARLGSLTGGTPPQPIESGLAFIVGSALDHGQNTFHLGGIDTAVGISAARELSRLGKARSQPDAFG